MEGSPAISPVTQIIHKPRSFLSTIALGLSGFAITLTLASSAIVLYAMNIGERKSGDLLDLIKQSVRSLPELRKALPPAIADVLSDARRPDYAASVEARATLVFAPGEGFRPVIEIENKGMEMVTLLSLRVVLLDQKGLPLADWNVWGATPFAADDEWRGPLLPGAKRRFSLRGGQHYRGREAGEGLKVELEITDLRVWCKPRPAVLESGRDV